MPIMRPRPRPRRKKVLAGHPATAGGRSAVTQARRRPALGVPARRFPRRGAAGARLEPGGTGADPRPSPSRLERDRHGERDRFITAYQWIFAPLGPPERVA